MCALFDALEFLEDERFHDNGGRDENRELLADLISEKLQTKTVNEWVDLFNAESVLSGPIYDMEQALEHPQIKHRQMVVDVEHPTMGVARLLGLPVKFSDTPG
jgi:glutaryl-CoA transferase